MPISWKKYLTSSFGIFSVCFIQVNLVTINVYQIAQHKWIGMLIVGFLISFLWTFNVSAVAFGSIKQRIIYGLGGATGCLTGSIITNYLY